ncbi:MAG: YbjN domain-containing protein [Gemmataceae bacterium]|nr:YbjN domain-containing protein [Gemmataceae bacterium]
MLGKSLVGVLSLALAAAGAAQDKGPQDKGNDKDKSPPKVQRSVTSAKLESILQDMKIKYAKTAGKNEGVHYYDFERNNFKVRLHNYQGRDLWVDVHFTDKVSLDEINQWNVRAKFSRAVLIKNADKQSTSLEAQIDCEGGVTDGMIRQFILRFDGEIKAFVQFLTK